MMRMMMIPMVLINEQAESIPGLHKFSLEKRQGCANKTLFCERVAGFLSSLSLLSLFFTYF